MAKYKKAKRDWTLREKLAHGPVDMPFLMLILLLLAIGLVMVFSASYASAYLADELSPTYYIRRQCLAAVLGLIAMYLLSVVNYQWYRIGSLFLLAGSFLMLFLVLTPLGTTNNGAQRWLFGFQPSEFAKIAVILFFSARLSVRNNRKPKRYSNKKLTGRLLNWLEKIGFIELIPYAVILVFVAVLMIMEPHMSGTILIFIGAASVLFASGVKLYWFFLGGASVVTMVYLVIKNSAYMVARVQLWLDPWSDTLGDSYQTIQSLLAIGSGGLTGLGLGKSRQKYLYLPEPENDFIFSIVVEELGLVGATIVIILFALLIIRGYWIALHSRDRFGSLTVVGITTLLAMQVFLNIGVVTNMIPNTGISLPFFSFGGTALLIQLAEMGIILSISRQVSPPKQKNTENK